MELLEALLPAGLRCKGLHPVIRAAVLSFGFVYIHPFEDGNGRISRYLIHDIYVRDGLTPASFINSSARRPRRSRRGGSAAPEDGGVYCCVA